MSCSVLADNERRSLPDHTDIQDTSVFFTNKNNDKDIDFLLSNSKNPKPFKRYTSTNV